LFKKKTYVGLKMFISLATNLQILNNETQNSEQS